MFQISHAADVHLSSNWQDATKILDMFRNDLRMVYPIWVTSGVQLIRATYVKSIWLSHCYLDIEKYIQLYIDCLCVFPESHLACSRVLKIYPWCDVKGDVSHYCRYEENTLGDSMPHSVLSEPSIHFPSRRLRLEAALACSVVVPSVVHSAYLPTPALAPTRPLDSNWQWTGACPLVCPGYIRKLQPLVPKGLCLPGGTCHIVETGQTHEPQDHV